MDQFRLWNDIAASFDATRERTWPHVLAFLAAVPPGRLLDLMAGNGRHLPPALASGHDVVAADWSQGLCRAAARHAAAVQADATRLPFDAGTFDAGICVAGLHGLVSPEARATCVAEARRVLRRGAIMQWTVWSREAPRFRAADLPPGPTDVTIPWRRDGHDATRHLSLYTAASLEEELTRGGFEVLSVDAVAIAADEPDNLVAVVRA